MYRCCRLAALYLGVLIADSAPYGNDRRQSCARRYGRATAISWSSHLARRISQPCCGRRDWYQRPVPRAGSTSGGIPARSLETKFREHGPELAWAGRNHATDSPGAKLLRLRSPAQEVEIAANGTAQITLPRVALQ